MQFLKALLPLCISAEGLASMEAFVPPSSSTPGCFQKLNLCVDKSNNETSNAAHYFSATAWFFQGLFL